MFPAVVLVCFAVPFAFWYIRSRQNDGERPGTIVTHPESNDGVPWIRKINSANASICIAWDVLSEDGRWRDHAKEAFEVFAAKFDVYLMCRIKVDREKAEILSMLKGIRGLVRHKILFCETDKGYYAFTLQLKPSAVVIHDEKTAAYLSTMLPDIIFVGAPKTIPNVTCVASFHELLKATESPTN